ncbi:phosphate/phosphite/phosphonate ABC transporter substrate-binding protein [Nocardia jinanensis]|uniref:Phosphonates-binding protein n=1 Tax=Nocardia jinanensis TaxID=382504 RepID=A0A917VSJ1_9NOCA|nr:phosphate/phosphite/phosphonate ABC transporter substrate-binding protein [Nocardia jinanensis]GGL10297.1 phosphonates-binding protein [Nocardia jinanensis]
MSINPVLRRNLAAAACAVILCGVTACGDTTQGNAPDVLKVGLPPSEANANLQAKFEPLTLLIAAGTGKTVEVKPTSDYLSIVEAMRSGLIDVAMFSPFPTPLAQAVAGVEPLVVARGAAYSSVFVCRTGVGINSIDDLRGRKVAFVDAGSTSGNYIPKLLLKRAGIDPETDIEGIYAGGHDTAELAVKQGSVDCAADARSSYQTMVDKGVIDGTQQAIVAESDPIPVSLVVIARKDLDPALGQGIVRAFVGGKNAAALGVVGATRFDKAQDSDFAIFRDAAAELGVDLAELSRK